MTRTRIPPLILILITLATQSNAGIIGWFTSEGRDWQFVQQTGGIRIGDPMDTDGKIVLPVDYDVSGLTAVTRKPITLNSGLAVRKIKAQKKDNRLVLQVFTQLMEKSSITGPHHLVDLTGIPIGTYDVYYESAEDEEKFLGHIKIR